MTITERIAHLEELAGKAQLSLPLFVAPHYRAGTTRIEGNIDGWMVFERDGDIPSIETLSKNESDYFVALANEALPVIRELVVKSDAEMERVKACEHIAEGDDGWPELRDICPSTAAVAKLRDENDKLKWQVRDTCARAERAEALLRECNEAMNPPDRGGISLDTWNQRLKGVTAKIRYLFQASEPVSRAALSPKGEP